MQGERRPLATLLPRLLKTPVNLLVDLGALALQLPHYQRDVQKPAPLRERIQQVLLDLLSLERRPFPSGLALVLGELYVAGYP